MRLGGDVHARFGERVFHTVDIRTDRVIGDGRGLAVGFRRNADVDAGGCVGDRLTGQRVGRNDRAAGEFRGGAHCDLLGVDRHAHSLECGDCRAGFRMFDIARDPRPCGFAYDHAGAGPHALPCLGIAIPEEGAFLSSGKFLVFG